MRAMAGKGQKEASKKRRGVRQNRRREQREKGEDMRLGPDHRTARCVTEAGKKEKDSAGIQFFSS